MERPPDPEWWPSNFVSVAQNLEGDTHYRARGGRYTGYEGPIWHFVERYVPSAYRANLPVVEACDSWHSGAYLLETVPSVLYILMRHGDDPEEAIVRAVNDSKDNDTVAAIVGAAVGALHGKKGLPPRWIKNLSGRTTDRDDGRMFDLLEQAKRECWETSP